MIEKEITEAGADNESDRQVKDQVLKDTPLQAEPLGPFLLRDENIGSGKTEHIHQSVPTELDRPDFNDVRIYVRKFQQMF